MLHVILLILKILGIILLSILTLLLLIICAVLFVPVTYRVRAEKKETLQVSAVAGWFFRALSVHYSLDGADDWKQDLRVRVFGITVLDLFGEKKPKKKRPKKKKKAPKDSPPKSPKSAGEDRIKEPEGPPELPGPPIQEPPEPPVQRPPELPMQERTDEPSPGRTEKESDEPSPGRTEKESDGPSPAGRIRRFFQRLLYAIRSICDKIKEIGRGIRASVKALRETVQNLWKRKNDFLEFWNLEEHRRARGAIYKELRYLWKKSRPRRIEGQVSFGFEDPSLTGMCMGFLSVLYAWYPKKFQLLPDFDREILEGKLLITGRIRLYVAALILWRVWFNKDIRHMYEHWQEL